MAHKIIVKISPTGEIEATVEGISGPACTKNTEWLRKLGEVLEDKHTADFHKPAGEGVASLTNKA